ncbi:hypothetical protein [Saccharothrix obliqua]|uniref:hypothetical protein n=1 Tax=Saccharothrix obliqua TaxID=2861747 RepID=UPI001C5F4573|nr:hypothetical protein [Saccharothrix obliqua]MBW4717264.1 hypothetical protein [Saccharothrix obliqua]
MGRQSGEYLRLAEALPHAEDARLDIANAPDAMKAGHVLAEGASRMASNTA